MSWQRGHAEIQRLIADGELEQVAPSAEVAGRLVADADAHIGLASKGTADDPAGALQLSYDAARKAAAALLAVQGLRATTRGGHIAVIDAVRAQFNDRGGMEVFGTPARHAPTPQPHRVPRRRLPQSRRARRPASPQHHTSRDRRGKAASRQRTSGRLRIGRRPGLGRLTQRGIAGGLRRCNRHLSGLLRSGGSRRIRAGLTAASVRSGRPARRFVAVSHAVIRLGYGETRCPDAFIWSLVSGGREPPLYLVERLWRGSVGAGCSPRRVGLYPPVT